MLYYVFYLLKKLIVHFQNYIHEEVQQQNLIKDSFTTDILSDVTICEQK